MGLREEEHKKSTCKIANTRLSPYRLTVGNTTSNHNHHQQQLSRTRSRKPAETRRLRRNKAYESLLHHEMHFEPMQRLLLGVLLWGGRGRALRRNTHYFVSSRHVVVVRNNHVCFGNNNVGEISTDTSQRLVSDRDSFLFGNDMSTFSHCGVTSELATALLACGKQHATTIQAKSFAAISKGQDIVIGSETGSGKTLAYLVPIIHQLLEADDYDEIRVYPHAVVMCPNKELAAQVHRMASELMAQLNLLGKTNIRTGKHHHNIIQQIMYEFEKSKNITSWITQMMFLNCMLFIVTGLFNQQVQYWPRFTENDPSPSIAVCTPAFLAHFIKGPNIQEVDLFRNVRHLVLDEVSHRSIFPLSRYSSLFPCSVYCLIGEFILFTSLHYHGRLTCCLKVHI